MSKTKVSILLLGEIHRDPLAPKAMREEIFKLAKSNTPVLFCEEDSPSQTLENKLEGNQQILLGNSKLLTKIPQLMGFLKRKSDLYYGYFLLNDRAAMETELIKQGFSLPNAQYFSNAISRHAHYEESIKLIDAFTQLKIPYLGIDAPWDELQHPFNLNSQQILEKEALRIQGMTSRILMDALPQLHAKNGIIVVQLGANHVRNLASHLRLCYKENPALLKKYDIQIHPIKLFSPYVEDGIDDHHASENASELIGFDSFTEIYKGLHCKEIFCTEKPNDQGRMQLAQQFILASQYINQPKAAEQKETAPLLAPTCHDSPLVSELTKITNSLKKYRNEKTDPFFKAFEAKDYNKALRIVCYSTLPTTNAIVSILIENQAILKLDPNKQAGDRQRNAFHLAAIKGGTERYNLLTPAFQDEQMKDSDTHQPDFYLTPALATAQGLKSARVA